MGGGILGSSTSKPMLVSYSRKYDNDQLELRRTVAHQVRTTLRMIFCLGSSHLEEL